MIGMSNVARLKFEKMHPDAIVSALGSLREKWKDVEPPIPEGWICVGADGAVGKKSLTETSCLRLTDITDITGGNPSAVFSVFARRLGAGALEAGALEDIGIYEASFDKIGVMTDYLEGLDSLGLVGAWNLGQLTGAAGIVTLAKQGQPITNVLFPTRGRIFV